ncbi:MAG: PAS domain-containing protein, partial [Anaerolineaceae bacterium]|nr:PAS domain-containing protein [Anaerolineaceae bacterium]
PAGGKEIKTCLDALRRGEDYKTQFTQISRSGTQLWIELCGIVLTDEKNGTRGYVLVCRDLTDYRLVEEENERQRVLLEEIFAANPGGMAVVSGPYLVFQLANESFRGITPYPEIDPLGRMLDEIWSPSEGGFNAKMILPVLEEEASITVNCITRWGDGTQPRTLTLHARPVDWLGERSVLLVVWETTELERALEDARRRAVEAEEGRRILDALLEYIPEGITVASAPDFRVIYHSKYDIGLIFPPSTSAQSIPLKQYGLTNTFRSDGVTQIKSDELPLVLAATRGDVIENQEIVLRRDSQTIHLSVNAGPIRDNEGNITGAVSTVRDITERKRGEMHQRFLSELGRALVALRSPEDLMEGIAYRLGRYLVVDRCYLSLEDVDLESSTIFDDYHRSLPGLVGTAPFTRFPSGVIERLKRGKPVVIADITRDPLTAETAGEILAGLQILSLIEIPWLNREGKWSGTVMVASRGPRVWRQDEVDLVHSVADLARLALENALLFEDLREFRHRFEVALRNAPIVVFSTDRHLHCTWIFNPGSFFSAEKMLGHRLDLLPYQHGGELRPLINVLQQVIDRGEGMREEIHLPVQDEMMSFNLTVEPLRDVDGQVVGLTCAALEVTKQRRMEAEALLNLAHIEVQHRLIREREQERMRIARDLHDGPLQDLIASNFTLVEAMEMNDKESRYIKMHELQRSIYKQIEDLRRFCNDLRPPVLGPFGLGKTIQSHLETFRVRYPDQVIEFELDSDQQVLPEEMRMILFRAYQELLNNIVRHAQAKKIMVRFHLEPDQVVLEVEDDGVGFAVPGNWLELAREGHLGLVGLRERVEMAGGKVEFKAQPGQGTNVRIVVPREQDGLLNPSSVSPAGSE